MCGSISSYVAICASSSSSAAAEAEKSCDMLAHMMSFLLVIMVIKPLAIRILIPGTQTTVPQVLYDELPELLPLIWSDFVSWKNERRINPITV